MGRDTAAMLAERGCRVALLGRTQATLEATADYLREEVDEAAESLVLPTDVSDRDAVFAAIERVVSEWGRVDYLANVAGSAPLQPIPDVTPQTLRQCLAVNLEAVVWTTQACWPHFRERKGDGGSSVCNVSSMAAIDPFTGFNIYAAAKAGVNLFTKATADEGKRFGLRASAVAPGAIETPMLRENFPEKMIPQAKTLDPLVVAGVIRDLLLGERAHEPGECVVLPSP